VKFLLNRRYSPIIQSHSIDGSSVHVTDQFIQFITGRGEAKNLYELIYRMVTR